MTPTDFGLGVLASWLANKLGTLDENNQEKEPDLKQTTEEATENKIEKNRMFHSFDVFSDLEEMVSVLDNPVAYLLIETEPTTHYHLVSLVLESKLTGEWYYFRRGRIAFQGSGGGHQQAQRVISVFKKYGIPISVWVAEKTILDDFEDGYVLWSTVFRNAIPFRAAQIKNEKWKWIKKQAEEVLDDKEFF